VPATADYGDDYLANSLRLAGYAQDEWNISPQWAAYAGLRWEGIRTQSEGSDGLNHSNLSSVWTPLLHAVYKFDPKSRDQIRISLTRSYRSPDLSDLIGTTWLAKGTNSETNPDRTGNPNLKPELATGVDLAYEVYLNDGGMLSANLFARRISDLMRTLTTAVPQGDGSTRWVASPQNIGNATTQGIELEAKFRLTTLWPEAPAVDLRSNASLYQSRVDGVPGPDNRLSQQAAGSLNLGADYKIPQTPVTVGGNVNWTPGYRTRLSENQWAVQSPKRVIDLYGLYQSRPMPGCG
jgi:iron complex outermembrane receptor protein